MFPSNRYFIEKLVQAKQEEIYREIRGFNEYETQNNPKSALKFGIKPKVLRWVGVIAILAWLVIIIN